MDLALTSEEMKFRSDLRAWLSEVLPEGSPRRGKNLFTQSRDDTVWWQQTLNEKGWAQPFSLSVCCHQTVSCLLYTSPSPRDQRGSRMPSSA